MGTTRVIWIYTTFSILTTPDVSARLTVEIVPDPLTPVYGYRYFVRASLIVELSDKSVFQEKMQFKLINKGKTCAVSNWKFCPLPPVAPKVWSCNCSSRTEHKDKATYRFYFYIEKIDDSYSAEQVTAKLTSESVKTVQMSIVKFSVLPSSTSVFRCCDTTQASLNWNLITRGHFQDRISVESVTWHRLSLEDVKANRAGEEIAKYEVQPDGQVVKSFSQNHYDITDTVKGDLRFLRFFCDPSLHEKFIGITVKFNETTYLNALPSYSRGRVARSTRSTGQSVGCGSQGDLSLGTNVNLDCKTTTTTVKPSPTTTTTTTSAEMKIPQLAYRLEHPQLFELVHRVQIIRDVPPPLWRDFFLRVEETFSGDGKVLVICGVSKLGIGKDLMKNFLGTPPVNITIYTQIGKATPKLLTYGINEPRVPYTVRNVKDLKFICRLLGPAMDCVDASDKRCANLTNSTEKFNRTDFAEHMDAFLLLYALELFLALSLLMWTFSNLFEHLRMVMTHERMQHEITLQARMLGENMGMRSSF